MSKFIYKRTNKEVTLVASGGLGDVIAEIGYIIHRLHAGMMANAPEAAKAFRHGIIQMVVDPETVIWDEAEKQPGEVMNAQVTEKAKE